MSLSKKGLVIIRNVKAASWSGLRFSQGEWIFDRLKLSSLALCSMQLDMKAEDWLPGSGSEMPCDSELFPAIRN